MLRQFRRQSIAARLRQRMSDEKLTQLGKTNDTFRVWQYKERSSSRAGKTSISTKISKYYKHSKYLCSINRSISILHFRCLPLERKSNLETGHKEQINGGYRGT